MSSAPADLERYQKETAGLSASALLEWGAREFAGAITFASSLGAEDQVITWMIASKALTIPVFTLDTGRMFGESYELMAATESELGVRIDPYFPDAAAVEGMVRKEGINLFYESVEKRKRCCHVRKVEPLRRALAGKQAWITGMRRSQSVTRADLSSVEWDAGNGLYKLNPLLEWSEEEVWKVVGDHGIPYNKLHDKGFRSIGCAPCTRAVQPGEDARAGRWWWENPEHKECGLHVDEESEAARPAVQVSQLKL